MPKKKDYELLVEDYQVTPFVIGRLNYVMAERLVLYMSDPPRSILEFVDGNVNWYAEIGKWEELAPHIVKRLLQHPAYYDDLTTTLRSDIADLKLRSQALFFRDLSNLGVGELHQIYREVIKQFELVYERGMVPTITDLHKPYLTDALKQLLVSLGADAEVAFVTLTTPNESSGVLDEERDLLTLALDDAVLENSQAIVAHYEEYFWLKFGYEGPLYTTSDIWRKIQALREDREQARIRQAELSDYESRVRRQLSDLVGELLLDDKMQAVFAVARDWLLLKALRKEAFFACYAAMDKLAGVLAKHLQVDKQQLKFLTPREVEVLVQDGRLPDNMGQRLEQTVFIYEDGEDRVLVGGAARRYLAEQTQRVAVRDDEVIRGQMAYEGKVRGVVKLIRKPQDMVKMEKGNILVSPATNPNLLPAMQEAAAIVTDVGGITCHAAIVARELKIPCVVGTKGASQVLKDGDMVEVDADNGVVRVLKREK